MPVYTVESDDDVEMSLPQPIFEVIRAPELSSWDHAALIQRIREWERYVEKMCHRCTTTGKTYENVVATVKGCVKRKMLKNMTPYVLKKPAVDVIDVAIMGALKMDLSTDDCDARVFRYYEDFNGIIEDNGRQGLIGTDNTTDAGYKSRMKTRWRLLVENLQPPVLKAQITRLLDSERRDCKSDGVALFDLLLEHAKVQQRFHRMSPDYTRRLQSQIESPRRPAMPEPRPSRRAQRHQQLSRLPPPVRHNRLGLCLRMGAWYERVHTGLKTAQQATDAQKEANRTRYQAEKEQRTQAFRSKAARTVVLDLELVTIAGCVSLRSVPCLILEDDGDEFLLGKDALKRLGIVVDQSLAQLADSTLLTDEGGEFPVGAELPDKASTLITTLDQLLEQAVANGLPQEHVVAVRELLELFLDIWRAGVGAGRAANVEPLRATLRVDAKPYRSPPRKYALLQAEFIRKYVRSLVADGLMEKNNATRWACAVVPVRKLGSRDKFRLTIEYRPVNRQTIPIAGVMPSAAVVMKVLLGQRVFARFDLTQGFWQLPLHPDSQELFSFVTP
ncbi:unnamed protein product [Phytophthora fragariaefolia]|uniref:Unnamed protein product n=1 Tax=Phytophthora fragariaefolia TaxID=1490495 RepID=A0A9W6Y9T4_9STRA|nr:unnamed protein product [Phytophthora fragariaefolia]